jgi:hypothetical protein
MGYRQVSIHASMARTAMDEHEFRRAVLLIVWRLFDANL